MAERVLGGRGIVRSSPGMSVVLASHSAQILRLADRVLLMSKGGEVVDSGTYAQLAERHAALVEGQRGQIFNDASSEEPSREADAPCRSSTGEEQVDTTVLEEYRNQSGNRINDLRRQKGDWRSYSFYLGAMGWVGFSLFVAGATGYVAFSAIFGVWLTWWAEDTSGSHSLGYWLGLYATWAVLIMFGMLFVPV